MQRLSCEVCVTGQYALVLSICTDGITVDEEYIHIDLPLFVFYTVLALLGVFFAAACLLFNLWCKDIKYVTVYHVWLAIHLHI